MREVGKQLALMSPRQQCLPASARTSTLAGRPVPFEAYGELMVLLYFQSLQVFF